jgi:hypothetical protein
MGEGGRGASPPLEKFWGLFTPPPHLFFILIGIQQLTVQQLCIKNIRVFSRQLLQLKAKETKKCHHRQLVPILMNESIFTADADSWGHDYYSIWFNLSAAFFKSEKTTGVIKLKTHYFISNHFMKC